MPNSSKIHKKSELSIANFSSLILSKEDNNSSRSKNTSRTSKRKDNSSITKKQWYLVVYVEPSQTEWRVGKKEKIARKDQIEKVLKRPQKTA